MLQRTTAAATEEQLVPRCTHAVPAALLLRRTVRPDGLN